MQFECQWKNEKWSGRITNFTDYGTHYEINIQSRSSVHVLFGRTSLGGFACMPDFNAGCHLISPFDTFWNTERLSFVLGMVDGITVAQALYHLAKSELIDY